MTGGEGVYIEECKKVFILIDFVRENFSTDYFAKYAVSFHDIKITYLRVIEYLHEV